ncbi:Heterodimeric efflux ABC transporter, permease/ATP-binding subunit 2 [Olavius algarvensis spirochete endosymbiont]|nr:Heterodimeric efflux ABC transporter, permease/ATP-binding subunit 2 [Olavius algarvensis spirochete endosymbiont]
MSAMVVLMIIVAAIEVVQPFIVGWLIDRVIIPENFEYMYLFVIVFGLLGIIQAANIFVLIVIAGKLEVGICYDIRKEGFNRLQELSFSYYDRTPTGWIMTRMTSDITRLGDVITWGFVDISWGLAYMLIMAITMFAVNFRLAMVSLSVIPPLILITLWFQKKLLRGYRKIRNVNSRLTAGYNEGIEGARTTKTLVREKRNTREFEEITNTMRRRTVRTATVAAFYLPAVLTFGAVGTALALWRGGSALLAGTGITYGALVSFVFATAGFFEPVMELSRVFADLQYAQASAEKVLSLLEEVPDIREEGTKPLLKSGLPGIEGAIRFESVDFQYRKGEVVLQDFNLEVQAGEILALVGESGAGKSTVVNLVCRFYEPTRGRILIDGIDYRKHSQVWLQSRLGYVLQTPHLFSGSVMENIRYGRLEASDDEVIEAAKLVGGHDFILNMVDGYASDVGTSGAKLSMGEKQLISFARAILVNPAVFVLDEATSSVDTQTEEAIRKAIHRVLERRTSFIIAHRLSTIREADRIVLLSKGRIIEEGPHETLIRRRGAYWELYTRQLRLESETRLLE